MGNQESKSEKCTVVKEDSESIEKFMESEMDLYNCQLLDIQTCEEIFKCYQKLFGEFYEKNFDSLQINKLKVADPVRFLDCVEFQDLHTFQQILIESIEISTEIFGKFSKNLKVLFEKPWVLIYPCQKPTKIHLLNYVILILIGLLGKDMILRFQSDDDDSLSLRSRYMSSFLALFYKDNFMRVLHIVDDLEKENKKEEVSCVVAYILFLIQRTFSQMESINEFSVSFLFIELLTEFQFSEWQIQTILWPPEFISLVKRFVKSKAFASYGKAANSLGLGSNNLYMKNKKVTENDLVSHMNYLIDNFLAKQSILCQLPSFLMASVGGFGYIFFANKNPIANKGLSLGNMNYCFENRRAESLMTVLHELIHEKLLFFTFKGNRTLRTPNISPLNENLNYSTFDKLPESGRSFETCFGFSVSDVLPQGKLAKIILDEMLWEDPKLFKKRIKIGLIEQTKNQHVSSDRMMKTNLRCRECGYEADFQFLNPKIFKY